LNFPDPLLQLGFATLLDGAREKILLAELRKTVGTLDTPALDTELAKHASATSLSALTSFGLRGETVFPVPLVLRKTPSLIGYYRLLFGYSQKQFYTGKTGASCLKAMEVKGVLTSRAEASLEAACSEFARVGNMLVQGLGATLSSAALPHELTLLTLGAQFRGGANNQRGSDGIKAVFAVLRRVFEMETETSGERSLTLRNAAGKLVEIELAGDPDALIKSTMSDGQVRSIVAIEVKAGEDHSNIWNRIGEAEKSHLKAKNSGINERWTIINDPQAPTNRLRSSSPSTTRFYQLLELTDAKSAELSDFRSRVRDLVGL
jgi:hypothetical protein